MRSKIFTLLVAALTVTTASAQWNTGSKAVSIYDCTGQGSYFINSPQAARTADGKTWLSYMIRENGGTHTYVQLLDKGGNKQFDGMGICLNDYPSPTWWSGYRLAVASDGSALVSVADSRTEKLGDGEDGTAFVPAIYKIGQDGSFEWGLNGISFSQYQYAPYTEIYVYGDDIYFQFSELSTEKEGTYVNRISMDGVVAFDECKHVEGQLVKSLDGDFLQVFTDSLGVQVNRLDHNLNAVWTEPVVFDTYENNSYDLQPFSVAEDGEGGVAIAFVRNMGMFAHNVRLQHVGADGELQFGLTGIDAYNGEDGDHSYCGIGVNKTTKQIMVDWEDELNENSEKYYTTAIGSFSFGGERGLGDYGKQVLKKTSDTGYAYGRIGMEPLENGDWILAVRDFQDFTYSKLVVMRVNKDGETLWQKSYGDKSSITDPTLMVEDDSTYVVYLNLNSLDIIRLSNADGSSADADVAAAPQALTAQAMDANTLKVNVEAEADAKVIVAMTDSTVTNDEGQRYANSGVFGCPVGSCAVGDQLDGGGRVVYVGAAGDFTADNLAAGTLYFFKAWSVNTAGKINTDAVETAAYTAAYTPWNANIDVMADGVAPAGWNASTAGGFTKQTNEGIVGTVTADEVGKTPIWIETPDIYLPEGDTRAVVELTMLQGLGYYATPMTFVNGDTLKIQATADDGKTYNDIAVYTKDNAPAFKSSEDLTKLSLTFNDFANQKVRLRFYVSSTQVTSFYLNSLTVAQKSDCDYPIDLKLESSDKDVATVSWSSQGEEGTWEVSYKPSASEEWGEPVKVGERQCTIEDLAACTSYDVRVRAVCSETAHSDWSDKITFVTGLFVPFELNISELTSMDEWLGGSGELADPTVLESGYDFSFYSYGYGSLSFYTFDETCHSWLISPQIDLGTGGDYTFAIDFTTGYDAGYVALSTDSKIQIVVAADGEDFYSKDVIRTISHDEIKNEETSYSFTAPLKGYTGDVRLGLYVSSTTGAPLPFDISKISVTKGTNGINSIEKDNGEGSKIVAIYNAAGQRTSQLTKGVNIVRRANGTSKKVFVK